MPAFLTSKKHQWLNWVVLALGTIAVSYLEGNTFGIG